MICFSGEGTNVVTGEHPDAVRLVVQTFGSKTLVLSGHWDLFEAEPTQIACVRNCMAQTDRNLLTGPAGALEFAQMASP